MSQGDSAKTLKYMTWEEFNSILQAKFTQTELLKSACCKYQDNGYEICEHMRNGEQSKEIKCICSQFQSIVISKMPLVLYSVVQHSSFIRRLYIKSIFINIHVSQSCHYICID